MNRLEELAPGRCAHASGALWLADSKTVLIADVHLGYGWAQRRRGELGPVVDTKSERKLRALVDELHPSRIIFLGDLVHAPKPSAPEREAIESTLRALGEIAKLVVIRGNHDRAFGRDFGHLGLTMLDRWQENGITAIHGDRLSRAELPEEHLVLGHLHPALDIRDAAGACQRVPLFLVSSGFTVLPAFSPFAAGADVSRGMPPDLRKLARGCIVQGVAVTGTRAVRLGPINGLRTNAAHEVAPSRRS